MLNSFSINDNSLSEDKRFETAVDLFNSAEWYEAHDAFEELWHESVEPERTTLQGFLQIAVAQVHLERANKVGATILFGEGLGRLRRSGIPDLGLDLEELCSFVADRLNCLQHEIEFDLSSAPRLCKRF